MEPNEIIGISLLSEAVLVVLLSLLMGKFGLGILVAEGILGISANCFLSLWGLWTFNPWIEGLLKGEKEN